MTELLLFLACLAFLGLVGALAMAGAGIGGGDPDGPPPPPPPDRG